MDLPNESGGLPPCWRSWWSCALSAIRHKLRRAAPQGLSVQQRSHFRRQQHAAFRNHPQGRLLSPEWGCRRASLGGANQSQASFAGFVQPPPDAWAVFFEPLALAGVSSLALIGDHIAKEKQKSILLFHLKFRQCFYVFGTIHWLVRTGPGSIRTCE